MYLITLNIGMLNRSRSFFSLFAAEIGLEYALFGYVARCIFFPRRILQSHFTVTVKFILCAGPNLKLIRLEKSTSTLVRLFTRRDVNISLHSHICLSFESPSNEWNQPPAD